MELIFEIVSYHRLSPEQKSKKSISNSITFGRSESNDWHLPDPEKVVSGTHARVEKQGHEFIIHDLSTNGLYINRAVEALGRDKPHKLVDGDLLTFGDYEVSVSFSTQEKPMEESVRTSLELNSIKHEESSPISEVNGINTATIVNNQSVILQEASEFIPTVSDDLTEHFDAPQAIPEEWDFGIVEPQDELQTAHGMTAKSADPAPVKQSLYSAPEANEDEISKHVKPSSANLDAFIKGLGVSENILPEAPSSQLMFEMGQSMKLMLLGLMESMRNRSNLKNEFRINQTTFQQKENNPLKFSASIDDVFQNLFLRNSSSFLPANKAINEAFNDTQKHDIALAAGTLGAIKGILSQLDPEDIENRDLKESLLDQVLPGQRQLRYWKMYQSLHRDMKSEIANQGSSALSDDFVKAYDKKIKSL